MKKLIAYIAAIAFAIAAASAAGNVVVLRSSASLYETKDATTVKWAADITAGTVLDKRDADIVSKNLYTRDKTWEDVKFYAVRYNGKDYFIQIRDSAAIAGANRAAVVADDAVLFTKAHPATFRNAWLHTGTIVALEEEPDRIFTEITFFDTDDGVRRTRNVLTSKLSNAAGDIKAVQLLEKARSMKDEGLQKDFLDSASKAADTEAVSMYVKTEVNNLLGLSDYSEMDIEQISEFGASIYTADGAKVNLRSTPGTAGEKVAQLENGTAVIASMQTSQTETIEGITASWVYVIAPDVEGQPEGWVFGGYLSEK